MKKILWIEDEPERVQEWRFFLERHGFKVQSAQTEAEAAEQIRCADFDLLIADLFIPPRTRTDDGPRTGLRLCNDFRRRNRTAPMVLFTNARDDELFKQLEDADPKFKVARKRYYDPRQLLALVQNLLK